MIEMSPFYSHQSTVGPVFDVATWSRGKTWFMGVCALLFGLLVVAAMILVWHPTLLLEEPPEVIADVHEETVKLAKDNPWAAYGGSAIVGLFGFISLAAAFASAVAAIHGGYYFRAGPGGISLRVPHGLDLSKFCLAFKRLEIDLPMSQIADWTIVQHKQAGSMSRNTGNVMAFLKIRMADGKKEEFNLDCFREPSFVIHSKINDALQMVPAQFGPADDVASTEGRVQTATEIEAKHDAILDALSAMIGQPNQDSAVVVSDATNGKCVQFVVSGDAIMLDLPEQAMDAGDRARAADYLRRVVGTDASFDAPSGFQVNAANIDDATGLALEVFDQVYQLRRDQALNVELVSL